MSYTKKYQQHVVYSYCYILISNEEQYSKPSKFYIIEDTINKFSDIIVYESVYCSSIFYRNINKPLGMTEKPMKKFY